MKKVYVKDDVPDVHSGCASANNLVRVAQRTRASVHYPSFRTIDAVLQPRSLPSGFFRDDFTRDGARYIIFSTPAQLRHLSDQYTWFVDATFRVVAEPFKQLVTIHVMLSHDCQKIQFPCIYIFMNRRRKDDYIRSVYNRKPAVRKIVMDFEGALWSALRELIDSQSWEIILSGCHFHYCQAIFRKVMLLGLRKVYKRDDKITLIIRV